MPGELEQTIEQIVEQSEKLRRQYVAEIPARLDFACIFCHDNEEYAEFSKQAVAVGQSVQDTPSGYTYLLRKPLLTIVGSLRLVKIRKPDASRHERGDTDFDMASQYNEMKIKFINNPHFELVERPDLEMMRLADPDFTVMVCFSKEPLSAKLGVMQLG